MAFRTPRLPHVLCVQVRLFAASNDPLFGEVRAKPQPITASKSPVDYMKQLYLKVHPDLFEAFRSEKDNPVEHNQQNLSRLNAIIQYTKQLRCVSLGPHSTTFKSNH